jgi:hypothetical protein
MATDAEKRAWLRDNTDQDIPARGRLRPDLLSLYDQAHLSADQGLDWDLDGAGTDDVLRIDEREPETPLEPERRPRTAKAQRAERRPTAATRADSLVGKLLGGKPKDAKAKAKKPPPRISVEKFTSRMYSSLGRMVRPLSVPMSNCLQAQAAMAGVLMEDVVRDTVVDRLLQPVARAEAKLDKVVALAAPPLIVLAVEQSFQLPPQEQMMRQAFLMPMLRESLRIGMEVSESYADQIKARIEQDAKWDKEIDELIAMIFAQPQATAEDVKPEPQMAGASA